MSDQIKLDLKKYIKDQSESYIKAVYSLETDGFNENQLTVAFEEGFKLALSVASQINKGQEPPKVIWNKPL